MKKIRRMISRFLSLIRMFRNLATLIANRILLPPPIGSGILSQRVMINTYPISSNPTVKWKDLKLRKFDVLEVARRRALAAQQTEEDERLVEILKNGGEENE